MRATHFEHRTCNGSEYQTTNGNMDIKKTKILVCYCSAKSMSSSLTFYLLLFHTSRINYFFILTSL